jgi:hypothetical protein
MEERRHLGLCFNCNEKFGQGHNRVCQRLFLLDLAEAEEGDKAELEEQTADDPLISLHAIANVHTSETMQVHIQLGGATLLDLESGSTHNFVSEDAASRTSLKLLPRGNMKVTVANGERVSCPGTYRDTAFSIQGEAFSTDFFALPLAGYDVALGIQWLASLGPTLWDFGALTMSFWRRDMLEGDRWSLQPLPAGVRR